MGEPTADDIMDAFNAGIISAAQRDQLLRKAIAREKKFAGDVAAGTYAPDSRVDDLLATVEEMGNTLHQMAHVIQDLSKRVYVTEQVMMAIATGQVKFYRH